MRWSHLVLKVAQTFLAHFLFHEVAGAVIAFCHVLSPFIAGGPASRLCEDCPAPKEIGRAPSELQSLMRISYAVFCLNKKKHRNKPSNKAIFTLIDNEENHYIDTPASIQL